jgi:dolichyl-phosphate beta-glucosyltransferase
MAVQLSLVIPAYDEATRLSSYLVSIRAYCQGAGLVHEVLVVDDGSQDGTAAMVSSHAADWRQLALIRHGANRGKGQALRTDVAAARGELILMADADGAAPIAEEAKLRQALARGADIAIGSRLLATEGVERSRLRRATGAAFAWTVRQVLDLRVRDSQCGFKMFRRHVAQRLFAMCQEGGYLIDPEILLHARRLGYRVAETPIAWRDVPGSKVRPLRDGWRMLTGLWRLRQMVRSYQTGPSEAEAAHMSTVCASAQVIHATATKISSGRLQV